MSSSKKRARTGEENDVQGDQKARRFFLTMNFDAVFVDEEMFKHANDMLPETIAGIDFETLGLVFVAITAERGEKGNPHYHIIAHYGRGMRYRPVGLQWKEILGVYPNVQMQLGSNKQARKYITDADKKGDHIAGPFERGTMKADTGAISATAAYAAAALEGTSAAVLAREHPVPHLRHAAGAERMWRDVNPAVPVPNRVNYWYWGPTGTGKTFNALKKATELCGGDEEQVLLMSPPSGNSHWMPEELTPAHRAVVIDDFREGQMNYNVLLRLLDVNKFNFHVRYVKRPWNVKWVFITCPYHPRDYTTGDDRGGSIDQLLRRLRRNHPGGGSGIKEFSEEYQCVPAAAGPDESE